MSANPGRHDGDRLQQIATMYAQHHATLHGIVRRRGSQNPDVVDDACQHAWAQLVAAQHIDLRPPRSRALAWLTTTAVRHAWLLNRTARRAVATDTFTIDATHELAGAGADELAVQHLRLELVYQLPERPRRFLLRLAVGYTYDEIAAVERVSYTTTNKQITRAKRLLRELDHAR
jgi:DNA-directed RNA polymerase specialized sigma24 family protein